MAGQCAGQGGLCNGGINAAVQLDGLIRSLDGYGFFADLRRGFGLVAIGGEGVICRAAAAQCQTGEIDGLCLSRVRVRKRAAGADGQTVSRYKVPKDRAGQNQLRVRRAVIGLIPRGDAGNGDGTLRDGEIYGAFVSVIVVAGGNNRFDGVIARRCGDG